MVLKCWLKRLVQCVCRTMQGALHHLRQNEVTYGSQAKTPRPSLAWKRADQPQLG